MRPYVRTFVTVHYFFLKLCSLLGLLKVKKCSKSFFEKIPVLPILAKNCPKLAILAQNAKKWRFFAFFRTPFIRICSFFKISLVFGVRKNDVFVFLGKVKNGPFWPNLGHFWLNMSVIYCLWFSIKFIYFALYVLIFPNFVFQVISRYSWT